MKEFDMLAIYEGTLGLEQVGSEVMCTSPAR